MSEKNKQRGFINGSDWNAFMIGLIVVSAVIGWGAIELLLWLFSHISIGWS